jgi:hypothetical protein
MSQDAPRQPAAERALWEAIDACRPGSDDIHLPELAGLAERLLVDPRLAEAFERVQRFDTRLAEALDDVPEPEGLQARLLAALAAARGDERGAAGAPSVVQPAAAREESAAPKNVSTLPLPGRRSHWAWTVAAVAAGLLVGAWLAWPTSRLTAQTLPLAAQQWFLAFDLTSAPWQDGAAQGYPFPARELAAPAARWAAVRTAEGYHLAAYDVSLPSAPAVLFVLRGGPRGLPTRPPAAPQLATGAQSVAVWQAGGATYALVVQGGPAIYRRLLPAPLPTA